VKMTNNDGCIQCIGTGTAVCDILFYFISSLMQLSSSINTVLYIVFAAHYGSYFAIVHFVSVFTSSHSSVSIILHVSPSKEKSCP